MFEFGLLEPFPWEKGIAPDASNDKCDVYVEKYFTKRLHTTYLGEKIKSMENWYVGLVKFKEEDDFSWIISDGKGVLDEATSIEQVAVLCDKWKMVKHGKA